MPGEQKEITILHVDDEPDFLAVTKALLERGNKDFRVDSAASAEEGMELLKSGKYDIVISDYQMPVMDGLEFLQKLRARGSTIPFIIFTGRGREEVAIESLNRGANHYLQKGGDRESLYGTLAHVVREEVAKQRAEDKLVEKEREYQTLLDSLPLNIFHIDRQNTFVHVNEVLAKHYGMKPEDFKGKTTKELFPEVTKAYTESDKEVLESGKPQIGVRRKVVTPQGVQWVRLDKVPVKEADGTVTGLIGFELDVTEQKRMEEELQESEQRLNSFMDSATDFFTLWDSGLNLVDINKAAQGFFAKGTKKEELRGQHILDIVPYIKGTDAYDKFKTVIKAGEPLITDYLIHHPELGDVFLTLRAFKVGDGLGVIFRDITERKRAGEQLGKIIEGSTIPTFVINSKHKLTHWNAAVESLTGMKREEVVGTDKQWVAFYPEKRPIMADLIVDGMPEREFKKKYGGKYKKSTLIEGAYEGLDFFPTLGEGGKWLEFSAAPIKDSTGSVIAALETLKDVTDQKRAEEELEKIIEGSTIPTVVINSKHKLTHWNSAVEALTGTKKEEVVGTDKQWVTFYPEKRPVMADLIVDGMPEREFKKKYEGKYKKSTLIEGAYEGLDFFPTLGEGGKWLEFSAAPIKDAKGRVIAALETLKDVTSRKRAEEELRSERDKFQGMLSAMADGVDIINKDYTIEYQNDYLQRDFGDLRGKKCYAAYMGLEEPCDFCPIQESMRTGKTKRVEFVAVDGRVYELRTSPFTDVDGGVKVIELVRDITEHKQMLEKLRQSEMEHQIVLDSVPISIFHIDRNSRFVQVNEVLANRYGMKPEDFKGKTTKELFPEQAESFADSDREVLECGEPQIGKLRKIKTSQGVRWVRLDKVPIKDAEGNVTSIIGFELDVTEREQIEEKLREREREHQTILDSVPASIFHIDRNSTFVQVNKTLATRYGQRPEDFKGKSTNELFPEQAESFVKSDREVLESGEPQIGVREKIMTPLGVRWMRIDKVPVKDADGNVTDLIGFELDVTNRKQTEEALRESEERFRSIVENSHDGILIIDDAFHSTYVNDELCRIIGYPREACIGQDFRDFLDEESKRLVADRYIRRQKGEDIPARYEFTIVRKDGAKRLVELSSVAIKDSTGNVQTVAQILDITERKRAVEKLQESENRLKILLDSIPSGIVLIDAETHVIFSANSAAVKMIDASVEQIVGSVCHDFICPAEKGHCPITDLEQSIDHSERVLLKVDGNTVPILKTVVPVMLEGHQYLLESFVDITTHKQVEEERESLLKELEAKNEELEHFTYTVSHDLRSPLVTIQGFIGLLTMDLERDAKEKAENDLKYISNAAAKMDELLNATLELSRIGRIANPPEDVPFGDIVEGALQQTAGAITANNIEVSVVDAFPAVHVDRMRIEEVLVNLITNSIKYRGEQPHPKIEIGHRVEDEETVFFVKDNGIGLDKGQHEEVFELFYQVGSGNGTGAGLAIVKRIIEVHEGRIWLESERDKGCTVCFTLPVN